uniref:Uncharacterized protein n=1 Tax=Aegilops tauschii subsp. strangulata TaxID=200361 RepID=A0A452YW77_AEGTS
PQCARQCINAAHQLIRFRAVTPPTSPRHPSPVSNLLSLSVADPLFLFLCDSAVQRTNVAAAAAAVYYRVPRRIKPSASQRSPGSGHGPVRGMLFAPRATRSIRPDPAHIMLMRHPSGLLPCSS